MQTKFNSAVKQIYKENSVIVQVMSVLFNNIVKIIKHEMSSIKL